MMNHRKFFAALAVVAMAFTARSMGDVLLEINDSNPNAVTITATGNFSSINATGISDGHGVDLLEFFTSVAPRGGFDYSGSLAPNSVPESYDTLYVNDDSGTPSDADIFNYNGAGYYAQNFSTTAPAFTGTATVDFSSVASLLPPGGDSGNILDGNSVSSEGVIGTWYVVPEPSTYALLFIALCVLALLSTCRGTQA